MVIVFAAERLGWSPVWNLQFIPGLTDGENYILFVVFLILGIFVGLLIVQAILATGKGRKPKLKNVKIRKVK